MSSWSRSEIDPLLALTLSYTSTMDQLSRGEIAGKVMVNPILGER